MSPETIEAIQLIEEFTQQCRAKSTQGAHGDRGRVREAQYALDVGDNTEAARLRRKSMERPPSSLAGTPATLGLMPMPWPM